jgi:polysaccharide export outer membrane protein
MFKTPKGVTVQKDSIPLKPLMEYTISKDDKFTFQLYTNNGEEIIDGMSGIKSETSVKSNIEYVVRSNGSADLPIIGNVPVSGLTVQQLEDTLSNRYEKKNGYIDPFVQVKLTNQRVIVFPGSGGDAKVILLQNNNTTLMEVIAQAGGIADRGRADKIKLMRTDQGKRTVYEIDLSTIDGLEKADLIVQSNDYVYVEPSEQIGKEAVESAAPIISLLSSALVIFTVFNNLK